MPPRLDLIRRPNIDPAVRPVYNRDSPSHGLELAPRFPAIDTPVDPRGELLATLSTGGVRAALIELNRASGYRFTALYRFDDPLARNLYFYDRENPGVEAGDDYPVEASYCVYVRDGVAPFVVEDAPDGPVLAGQAVRGQVKAYCGVPVFDRDGRTFASLCHFDLTAVPADAECVALMETLARHLARP